MVYEKNKEQTFFGIKRTYLHHRIMNKKMNVHGEHFSQLQQKMF